MQAEDDADGRTEPVVAGSGFDPLGDEWLSRAEIELLLRTETAIYRQLFPRAKLIHQAWNSVTFERGSWFWKSRDLIYVHMNGRIEHLRTKENVIYVVDNAS